MGRTHDPRVEGDLALFEGVLDLEGVPEDAALAVAAPSTDRVR